jgi:VanZ family protein
MKISFLLIFTTSLQAIETDKRAHILISAIITKLTQQNSNKKTAIAIGLSLGVVKELYDSTQPNNKFDVEDIIADVVGVVFGAYLPKPFGAYIINGKPCYGIKKDF